MPNRSRRRLIGLVMLALTLALAFRAPVAKAQQSQADCAQGWVFANGQCQPPPNAQGGNMDATCVATARFDYCRASAYVGCQAQGNGYACRLLQLSQSDPNTFQQIMSAQTACVQGNQQACAYLQRFRGTFF